MMTLLGSLLKKPRYSIAATLVAVLFFIGATLIPIWRGVREFWQLPVSLGTKLSFVWTSLGAAGTNATGVSLALTIVLSLLFGLNIALLWYYIAKHRSQKSSRSIAGKSLAGIVAGIFGIGCAACGAALLGALLSLIGAGGLLVLFPLHGQEFALVGIAILTYSNYRILQHLQKPPACDIEL